MEVVIVYKGALAFYIVSKEKDGVFNAALKEYGGFQRPAENVTLVRSIRHWTGSVDDHELMFELGSAIDRQHQLDPLFPHRGEDRSFLDNLV